VRRLLLLVATLPACAALEIATTDDRCGAEYDACMSACLADATQESPPGDARGGPQTIDALRCEHVCGEQARSCQ